MRWLLSGCAALLIVISERHSTMGHEMIGQKPIEFLPPFFNITRAPGGPHGRRNFTGINGSCLSSSECQKGLCCLLRGNRRTCQPLAELGAPCSDGEVKGGYHVGHCPCSAGYGKCQSTTRNHGVQYWRRYRNGVVRGSHHGYDVRSVRSHTICVA
uniref:Putative secreted salivary gland peptide n=1 Tax=Amblyomma americanum TaxID=6943 RepID=A0A0C9SDS0_AMBAM